MSTSKTLRIALAQTHPLSGPRYLSPDPPTGTSSADPFHTLRQNLKKAESVIRSLKAEEVDVCVFPEYFLQGIVEHREYLQELARTSGISIIGSIVELHNPRSSDVQAPTESPLSSSSDESVSAKWTEYLRERFPHSFSSLPQSSSVDEQEKEAEADRAADLDNRDLSERPAKKRKGDGQDAEAEVDFDRLLNTAYCFEGRTGNVIGRYVKKNLWIAERAYLTKGEEEHEIFELKGIKAGFQICWDLAHAEGSKSLAKRGVEVIFAPTFWMGSDSSPGIDAWDPPADYEKELLRTLAHTRAFETESVMAMCNAGGPRAQDFIGGSGVWVPFRGALSGRIMEPDLQPGLSWDAGESVKLIHVDLGVLEASRKTYKIRKDWADKQ